MKQLGVFGLVVPPPYGEVQVSTACLALVTEELARGRMSLADGGHSVVCALIATYGTHAQRERYLPRLATGELRATMALTEPGGGSGLQAMRTTAPADGDEWVVDGSKTWITNARRAGLIALLCTTDPQADPPHRGMSILLAEKGAAVSPTDAVSAVPAGGVLQPGRRRTQEISVSRPVATSNTKPRTLLLSGMNALSRIRWSEAFTSASTSGNASECQAGRLPTSCSIEERNSSSVKVSMPQSVWWMRTISFVPSSRWLMARDRIASSVTTPPALRITCDSPSARPRTR
jgi:hypothetical protein